MKHSESVSELMRMLNTEESLKAEKRELEANLRTIHRDILVHCVDNGIYEALSVNTSFIRRMLRAERTER